MIVRIMGEGQYEVAQAAMDRLNELDDALEAALTDDVQFRPALTALLSAIRTVGTPIADDELLTSDVVLPASDASVAEVRALFGEEGLIPD